MTTITYHKGKIEVQCIAEPTTVPKAAAATSKYMANHLRKQLMEHVVLNSTRARIIAVMTDDELVAAYASYQNQKYASVNIVR